MHISCLSFQVLKDSSITGVHSILGFGMQQSRLPSASSHRFLQFKLGLCLAPRELPKNCGCFLNQIVTKLNNSYRQKMIIIVKTCLFVSLLSLIIISNRFGSAGQPLRHFYQWLGIVRQSSRIMLIWPLIVPTLVTRTSIFEAMIGLSSTDGSSWWQWETS